MSSFSTVTIIYTIATSISRPTQSKKQFKRQRSNQFLLQLLFRGTHLETERLLKKTFFIIEMLKYRRKLCLLMSIKRVKFLRTRYMM